MHEKPQSTRKLLLVAFSIASSLLLVEFVAALITNSLALLADTGHVLGDAAALGLALWASFVSARQADRKRSYGYGRIEVLAALLNAIILLAITSCIVYKAALRIQSPEDVRETGMIAVALAGLAANILSGALLLRGARHNINVKAALFHVAGDALGSTAVLCASLVIFFTGWILADPVASLCVCTLIVAGAVRLFIESWHILMEEVPEGFNLEEAERIICAVENIISVHHIHAWAITSGSYSATAHVVIEDEGSSRKVHSEVSRIFREKWGIDHVTIQFEKQSEKWLCEKEECRLVPQQSGAGPGGEKITSFP